MMRELKCPWCGERVVSDNTLHPVYSCLTANKPCPMYGKSLKYEVWERIARLPELEERAKVCDEYLMKKHPEILQELLTALDQIGGDGE